MKREFLLEAGAAVMSLLALITSACRGEWWSAVWAGIALAWVIVAYLWHGSALYWKKSANYWREEYNDAIKR